MSPADTHVMNISLYPKLLVFELCLREARDMLSALELALQIHPVHSVGVAARTRRAIHAALRAWERLDDPDREVTEDAVVDMRRRGHSVITDSLARATIRQQFIRPEYDADYLEELTLTTVLSR